MKIDEKIYINESIATKHNKHKKFFKFIILLKRKINIAYKNNIKVYIYTHIQQNKKKNKKHVY